MENGRVIKYLLCDITGVLLESSSDGDGTPIKGSVEAVRRLNQRGFPVRFVTNESQKTRSALAAKLGRLGFEVCESHIFNPAFQLNRTLASMKTPIKPFFLVHPDCRPDLEVEEAESADNANCVVIGDAAKDFSYVNMNTALRILMRSKEEGENNDFFAMGKGRFYREDGQLTLDVGAYVAALEFATGKKAVVCGKPNPDFFNTAIDDLGAKIEETAMVGDDLISDVVAAQKCGIMGVLVRSGKFRKDDELKGQADLVVDNLAQFVDRIIENYH